MANNNKCTYRNPLVRDGESQEQRLLDSLDPEYVKVDERSISDLLRFIAGFAEELEYYGPENISSDDWRDFFTRDVTTTIALLTVEDPDAYTNQLDEIEDEIFDDEGEFRKELKTLFDLIGTLAIKIDSWYSKVPEGYKFRDYLHRSITAELRYNLHKSIAYYERAESKGLLPGEPESGDDDSANENILSELLAVWQGSFDDIDDSIFEIEESEDTEDDEDQKEVRTGFSFIRTIAESFIKVIKKTQRKVPEFIEETLTEFSGHQPQMGLMLAFLKLFRHAQDHINTLTRRHLNFYYEDVLQLDRKDAVPDKVYLLIELAKHVDSHRLKEGTLFKAGKDAKGNEVVYEALREVVLNKAKVKSLKSVYIDDEDSRQQVFEKAVANSKDGKGAELEDPSQGWKAFGESPAGGNETMQFSEIGFAVSSPILLLAEGTRRIVLDIEVEGSYSDQIRLTNLLKCEVTTSEGWSEIREKEELSADLTNDFILEFEALPADPPITAWNPEVHTGNYQSSWPILKLVLKKDPKDFGYEKLKDIKIKKVDITVDVERVKNLVLQNELGVLDPSKPFMPFGPKPAVSSEFYIGSSEVFSKNLDNLTLNVQWHELPKGGFGDHYGNYGEAFEPSDEDFKADFEILNKGVWEKNKKSRKELFEITKWFPTVFQYNIELPPESFKRSLIRQLSDFRKLSFSADNVPLPASADPGLEAFDEFDVSRKRGFARLVLKEPSEAFGHHIYPKLLTERITPKMDTFLAEPNIPNEPYTPKIKSIALDYKATESIELASGNGEEDRIASFFHISPFGFQKMVGKSDGGANNVPLLPQFKHRSTGTDKWHKGEFYIGLSDVDPPGQISLLFKVAEGSADPTYPKVSLDWFYLTNEGWKIFDQQDIVHDSTNDLLTTGIMRFNVPSDAASDSTLFPGNLTWIKAAVPENGNPDAVCSLIDVHAQAITVEFVDQNNDPNFLSTVLKAGTISKLKTKQSVVKKIHQPYASEGGKVSEQDTEYHRRVSERLRHKDRGVSIWDYERLVLEHFPSIYKAKCINHSTYDYSLNGDSMSSEFAPGFVTMVVIPDLKNKNAVEPLKPQVSPNVQNEIKKFLQKRITPFLKGKLKVINPLFEQVKVTFNVKLANNVDEGYYVKKLEEDIKRFLSPWAYEEGKDISFGGSIHQSVILNFIEECDYVDYVTDFRMDHYKEEKIHEKDVDEVTVTSARSVLVSHKQHEPKLIEEA